MLRQQRSISNLWDRQNISFRGNLLILFDPTFQWENILRCVFYQCIYKQTCRSLNGWENGFAKTWILLRHTGGSLAPQIFSFSAESYWPFSCGKVSMVWWGQHGIHDVSGSSRFLLTAETGKNEICCQEFCTRIGTQKWHGFCSRRRSSC